MRKLYISIGIIVAVVILVLVFSNDRAETGLPAPELEQAAPVLAVIPEFQSKDENGVTVIVTPKLSAESWKFEIAFDTHSVELDDDIAAVTTLVDDQGVEYRPLAWEGAGPGGHHREGVLIFDPLVSQSRAFTIIIKNVGGVSERSFSWNIK